MSARLAGIRADFMPMAPNTAVGFVLLGGTLLVMPGDTGSLGRKAIAVGTAGFVAGLVAIPTGGVCAGHRPGCAPLVPRGALRTSRSGAGWPDGLVYRPYF